MYQRVKNTHPVKYAFLGRWANNPTLKAYPLTLMEEREHVEALASVLAVYGKSMRQAIEQTDALGDKDTADICTEISWGVDKYLWFVEAHLG
jgi:starvation-inducible DNA-binding protein